MCLEGGRELKENNWHYEIKNYQYLLSGVAQLA